MTRKRSKSKAPSRRTIAAQIHLAESEAETARIAAQAAKALFKQAKKDFKEARRGAKAARKAVKALKRQLKELVGKAARPARLRNPKSLAVNVTASAAPEPAAEPAAAAENPTSALPEGEARVTTA